MGLSEWLRNRAIDRVIAQGFRPTPCEYWLAPNVGSDFPRLFLEPEQWATCRSRLDGYQIGGLNILLDHDHPHVGIARIGDNHWQTVVESGVIDRLREWDLPIAVELGTGLEQLHQCVSRLNAAGGALRYLSLDQRDGRITPDAFREIRQQSGAVVGIIEGYPSGRRDMPRVICEILDALVAGDAKPAHVHMDIDVYGVRDQGISEDTFGEGLRTLRDHCAAHQITFGVVATAGRTLSSAQFASDTSRFIARLRGHLGRNPDRIIVQSWWEDSAKGDDDFSSGKTRPHNAPETDQTSLTGLCLLLMGETT